MPPARRRAPRRWPAASPACLLRADGLLVAAGHRRQGLRHRRRHGQRGRPPPTAASRSSSPAATSTARPLDLADFRGKAGRGQRLGLVVHRRAAPRRPTLVDAADELDGHGRTFVGINIRDPSHRPGARAFVRALRGALPLVLLTRTARRCCASAARSTPNSVPEHRGARRRGPGRRQRSSAQLPVDHADAGRRRRATSAAAGSRDG